MEVHPAASMCVSASYVHFVLCRKTIDNWNEGVEADGGTCVMHQAFALGDELERFDAPPLHRRFADPQLVLRAALQQT